MTLDQLRAARANSLPVAWNGTRGYVLRVARDGTWADMIWHRGVATWHKRQPLDRLADWGLS